MESMQKQMQGILNVLTPLQQAKFLCWIEGGMNGTNFITTVKKVLKMNNATTTSLGTTDESESLSLSDMESLSSLSLV